jgi:hypothetical protein
MPVRSFARFVGSSLALLILLLATVVAAAPLGDLPRKLADELGFDAKEVDQLAAGELVVKQLQKEKENELAILMASLLDAPVAKISELRRDLDPLKSDKTIHAWGMLAAPITAASFAKLELPADELEKLAGDDAGSEFHLSKEEQELLAKRLAGVAGAEKPKAAMAAYREILAGRATAYQARGLAGIAPYQSGRKQLTPADYLKNALPVAGGVVDKEAPEFRKWLVSYPSGGKVANEQFVWLLQELNGRPAAILAHRAQSTDERLDLLVQRDFYVGHTFEALQILSGAVPSSEQSSVLFYTNRTFTHQVAGFGSSAAHAIGRKIMVGEITTLFESVRASLPAQ